MEVIIDLDFEVIVHLMTTTAYKLFNIVPRFVDWRWFTIENCCSCDMEIFEILSMYLFIFIRRNILYTLLWNNIQK